MPAKKPQAAGTQKKTGRRPGQPRDTSTVARRLLVERLWLQGWTIRRIAAELGVHKNSIDNLVNRHIRPVWKERMENIREEEFAKVALLERIAWEQFESSKQPERRKTIKRAAVAAGASPQVVERTLATISRNGEACWMGVIQWCLDWRARIRGDYSAQKMQHTVSGDLRVAGTTPEQFTAEALAELMEGIHKQDSDAKS
jgi:transcriptional regulator with XRE-family HTH domain